MRKLGAALLLGLLANLAQAGEIKVSQPWAKGILESSRTTMAYMELFSEEEAVIVAASSPLASQVEMRDMQITFDGGPMRPVKVDSITLPARKRVQLTPVSEHFLLQGLKQAIKAGDKLPLILSVRMKNGETRELKLEVVTRGM
ncbi:copper chaperone PCu(A)C [Uliginosibacterium aquaticum]|uniref:Copper chaperone PCu(A)C n=1 Tax=Uliginosibacterium aquaticum TaxID=2731212 RepID=A0ABX2IG54_9RHOO|nr:copper chaperone PCu(A)C [Uliginosibacterium aquaticum]NSL55686.1 copper chaperone PCu(A)C [Uliginosibacterium aquaticum]